MTTNSQGRTPRIAPQDDDQLLASLPERAANGASGRNLFATIMRSPDLYAAWRPFARHLNSNDQLDVRYRELLILRTAWIAECEYEWGSHIAVARSAGLSDREINAVRTGADHPVWNELESTLLRVPDQCRDRCEISDEVWSALERELRPEQLLEVLLLVGHYLMLAILINSARIPLEPGVPTFPENSAAV